MTEKLSFNVVKYSCFTVSQRSNYIIYSLKDISIKFFCNYKSHLNNTRYAVIPEGSPTYDSKLPISE